MSKLLENIFEAIGWLRIVASPLLIGLAIGSFIYFPEPNSVRLAMGIGVAVVGLLVGVLWANKIWKSGHGTMSFLARITATPELDKKKGTKDKERSTQK